MILPRTDLITDVRNYIRDKIELNRLIAGKEHSDQSIALSIELAIEEINGIPPLGVCTISVATTGVDIIDPETEELKRVEIKLIEYPKNMKWLFIQFIVLELLKSVLFLRSRNQLQYSDGGIAVNDEAGPAEWEFRMYSLLYEDAHRKLTQFKHAANVASIVGVGGIGSDYSFYFCDFACREQYLSQSVWQ